MALAILRRDEGLAFRFDLGSNRYWRVLVGDGRLVRRDGLELLADATEAVPLTGPLPGSAMGRGRFELPPDTLLPERRHVQLLSYRTEQMTGPAVSEVVEVPVYALSGPRPDAGGELAPPVFEGAMRMSADTVPTRPVTYAYSRAPLRHRRAPLSDAMFLDGLLRMLPTIAPAIGGLLRGLAPDAADAIATPAVRRGSQQVASGIGQIVGDPALGELLAQLVEQVAAAAAGSPAPDTPAARGEPAAAPAAPSTTQGHSQAMVAPALLAALPALAPLLQQVLNPQTVQAVLNAPNQHLQTITNGLRDLGRLALESAEQDLRHLRELNPGVDDPALDQLLLSMSASRGEDVGSLEFVRAASVRLTFREPPALILGGEPVTGYRLGTPWRFSIDVATPRAIPDATVEVCVKDADTLAVLFRRRQEIGRVAAGPLPGIPEVHLPAVRPDTDLLVTVALAWKNRKGDARGTTMQQRIRAIGELAFDRLDDSTTVEELDDRSRFADWWHRVWTGRLEPGGTRLAVDLEYLVAAVQEPGVGHMDTRVAQGPVERPRRLQLVSGMEVGADALSGLADRLGGSATVAPAVREALSGPAFARRLARAARHRFEVRGGAGDEVAVWVRPDPKLHRVVLQRPADPDQDGAVTATSPEAVDLPVPMLLRVVVARRGARPDGTVPPTMPTELDGLAVETVGTASLTPVPLVPVDEPERPSRRADEPVHRVADRNGRRPAVATGPNLRDPMRFLR